MGMLQSIFTITSRSSDGLPSRRSLLGERWVVINLHSRQSYRMAHAKKILHKAESADRENLPAPLKEGGVW